MSYFKFISPRNSSKIFQISIRNLFTIRNNSRRPMSTLNFSDQENTKKFLEIEMQNFASAYFSVKCHMKEMYPASAVANKFGEFLDYNVSKERQLSHVKVMIFLYHILSPQSANNNVKKEQFYLVIWLVEMLRSLIFMIDDMVDRSEFRCGKVCWYRNHKKTATNDFTCLYICIIKSLEKFCIDNDLLRRNLSKLFHDVTFETLNVIFMDSELASTSLIEDTNLIELYDCLCRKKVAYLLTLISHVAIYLADYESIPYKDKLDQLNSELSKLIQMKNDIADLPQTLETGKKKMEDISNGAITWCLVKALQDATEEQKNMIKKYYGRKQESSINNVYRLYNELEIVQKFKMEEANIISNVNILINKIPDKNIQKVFIFIRDTTLSL